MAAIPPFHEEPPIGTDSVVPPPDSEPTHDEDEKRSTPTAAAPEAPVKQPPPLPRDWSPVDPSPGEPPR